jgi:hypothetical protein
MRPNFERFSKVISEGLERAGPLRHADPRSGARACDPPQRSTGGNRKPFLTSSLFVACLLSAAVLDTFGIAHEGIHEFSATGDFDGDGRRDIVIVDKVTGNYRIAYQLAPGSYTWVRARASGVENVTGFSAGRLLNVNRDALAFTAPDANRVNVLDASNPNVAGLPIAAYPAITGPNLVIALDIGGAGDTAHHDLFVGSRLNTPPIQAHQLALLRSTGASFSSLGAASLPGLGARGNRIQLKTGQPEFAGLLLPGAVNDTFAAYDLSSGAAVAGLNAGALPPGGDYVFENFRGTALREFLFYKVGQDSLRLRPVQEPLPGAFLLGIETAFPLGQPVQQVFALPGAPGVKLLVIFGAGPTASVYNFDGLNAPVLLQSFTPPPGELFMGAAPLGNHHLMLFSAPAGETVSTKFQTHNFNGSAYTAGAAGNLPKLTALTGKASVFYFQQAPFISPAPHFLGSASAGDFTSLFNLPAAQVTAETFQSGALGLSGAAPVNLGALPPLTAAGLVNQLPFGIPGGSLAMVSFSAPLGEEVLEISISPAPGLYKTSVAVKLALTVPNPANPIFYRIGFAGSWITHTPGAVIPLFQDTTLSYYAQLGAGPTKTAIRHATYQFAQPAEQMDSDGDGVPDFVEIAKGLDPKTSGSDADGDGASDLCEIFAGTNPNNMASKPASCPLDVSPSTLIQGINFQREPNQLYPCLAGTLMRAHDLNGTLLASTQTVIQTVSGATDPAGRLTVFAEVASGLAVVATESHFGLDVASADKNVGRELLGLVPLPKVIGGVQVPYTYGNGLPNIESAGWIAAAQQAYSAAANQVAVGNLEIHDTLVALLFEKKIQDVLLSRGYASWSNVTLFPFRPTDAERRNPPVATLLALEKITNGFPGFRLKDLFEALDNALTPPGPGPVPELKEVTAEIYRISSLLNNGSPPGAYPPPVDVLRDFLLTGNLPASFVAQTTMNASQLAAAHTGANTLPAALGGRPTTDITLVVRPDTFAGECALLDTLDATQTRSLWHREGVAYRLLESFELPPGSKVQVFGYTDIAIQGCGSDAIEVISLALSFVPQPTPTDNDADLLLDALELLLFGSLSQNGLGDFDGDGFSNLQEFLDGSDPNNPLSKGQMVVNLAPPALNLELLPGGQLQLSFQFPAAYADKIQFGILSTPALGMEFTQSSILPVNMGGGNFQVILPNPGAGAQFYLVYLGLK